MKTIPLLNSKETAKVDDEDFAALSRFDWELYEWFDAGIYSPGSYAIRWVSEDSKISIGIMMQHEVLFRAGEIRRAESDRDEDIVWIPVLKAVETDHPGVQHVEESMINSEWFIRLIKEGSN